MIILDTRPREGGSRPASVALFGLGVIGFGVLDALRSRCEATLVQQPFDWIDHAARERQLLEVEAALDDRRRDAARVDIVWSAGRAGFLSAEAEVELELRTFRQIVAMAERLAQRRRTRFHLISSAGGLFEGQRHTGRNSTPAPTRPYGHMKLLQEELLDRAAPALEPRVYRVASAYGFIRNRFRPGFVSRLILDAIRRNVTHITGRMTTLRDFVFVPDVAAYIAERVLDDAGGRPGPAFLVHSRPCSLLEVQHAVELTVGRKLHVAYSLDPVNSADITFSPDLLPPGWRPSELRPNIGIIYRDALCGGFDSGRGGGPSHGFQPIR